MPSVDLNADMGESFGPWKMGNDDALLKIVTTANIACGFHAGDPDVMAKTMALAVEERRRHRRASRLCRPAGLWPPPDAGAAADAGQQRSATRWAPPRRWRARRAGRCAT